MSTDNSLSSIFKKIPMTILSQNIMPYAVRPQPPELLRDIRSFHMDMNIIDNIYHTQFNDVVFYTDLMYFVNNRSLSASETNPAYKNILRRHISLQNATNKEIVDCFQKYFQSLSYATNLNEKDLIQRNRALFGLLTPEERTHFINKYVLE
jgi:hypothetical protein